MSASSRWLRMLAEAHAFPFASEPSFEWGQDRLSREDDFTAAGCDQKLRAALRAQLRPMADRHSVDSLDTLASYAWFARFGAATQHREVSLDRELAALAGHFLELRGTEIGLRLPSTSSGVAQALGQHAEEWRWLTLRMPVELLVASIVCDVDVDELPWTVNLAHRELEYLLSSEDGRVAQTHLHIGAALSTSTLWSGFAATQRFSSLAIDPTMFDASWPIPFGDPTRFCSMLLVACIIRYCLGLYLVVAADGAEPPKFSSWLQDTMIAFAQRRRLGLLRAGEESKALSVIDACFGGPLALELSELRELYAWGVGEAGDNVAVRAPTDIRDPLRALITGRMQRVPVEPFFLRECLRLLRSQRSRDQGARSFSNVFWQYCRIRAQFHRFLTQEPGSTGLDWFSVFQSRLGPITTPLDSVLPALAIEAESRRLDLQSFEARTTPPRSVEAVRNTVLWYVQALAPESDPSDELASREATVRALRAQKTALPERALVFHFVRAHARSDPAYRTTANWRCSLRYTAWYQQQRIRANALEASLAQHPELLLIVRGVDVANLEYAIPTWAFAPLVRSVRSASLGAARVLQARKPHWKARPLAVTIHAGEDFRRLPDALRRMHELITLSVITRGDRIGHGLALGIDPDDIARRYPVVPQPRLERLDDLLWELACYRDGDLAPAAGRLLRVEEELKKHGRALFGSCTIDDLVEMRRGLSLSITERFLETGAVPPVDRDSLEDARVLSLSGRQLLDRYLSDDDVCQRGAEPVAVEATELESAMLRGAQAMLRRSLSALEVTIEANPSSNLLVGTIDSLRGHPALALAPVKGLSTHRVEGLAPLKVSLNSDDPTTFATCLADEYAHLYYALVLEGVASKDALDWLRELRDNGWRSRFSLPASAQPEALAELIEALDPRVVAR